MSAALSWQLESVCRDDLQPHASDIREQLTERLPPFFASAQDPQQAVSCLCDTPGQSELSKRSTCAKMKFNI